MEREIERAIDVEREIERAIVVEREIERGRLFSLNENLSASYNVGSTLGFIWMIQLFSGFFFSCY